jgi:hypothetical protein
MNCYDRRGFLLKAYVIGCWDFYFDVGFGSEGYLWVEDIWIVLIFKIIVYLASY